MLTVSLRDQFCMAEKLDLADREAGFFFCLTTGSGLAGFHHVDLAADNVPVAGLRRARAAV